MKLSLSKNASPSRTSSWRGVSQMPELRGRRWPPLRRVQPGIGSSLRLRPSRSHGCSRNRRLRSVAHNAGCWRHSASEAESLVSESNDRLADVVGPRPDRFPAWRVHGKPRPGVCRGVPMKGSCDPDCLRWIIRPDAGASAELPHSQRMAVYLSRMRLSERRCKWSRGLPLGSIWLWSCSPLLRSHTKFVIASISFVVKRSILP